MFACPKELGLALLAMGMMLLAGCEKEREKEQAGEAARLAVPALASAPQNLDGKLDDPFWRKAAVTENFQHIDGKPADSRTRLLAGRRGQTLFIAVECCAAPQAMAALKATVMQRDGEGIWDDDDVEIFIDPSGRRRSYYQIIINSAGTIYDAYHPWPGEGDVWWNGQFKSAVARTETSWIAQFALPLAGFDRTREFSDQWAFNVVCNRASQNEVVTWAPIGTDRLDDTIPSVHKPRKFGLLAAMPSGRNSGYHPPSSRVAGVASSSGSTETLVVTQPKLKPPEEQAGPVSLTLFDPQSRPDPAMPSRWVELTAESEEERQNEAAGAVAEFKAEPGAGVIYHLPRDLGLIWDKPVFSIASEYTSWAGYKELVIECVNDSSAALNLEVLLEDLTAYYLYTYRTENCWPVVREFWRGQLAPCAVKVKRGRSQVRLPLSGKFMTADGRREISLCEIWGVGLRAQSAGGKVRIAGLRLEGGAKGRAGLEAIWPEEATPLPAADKYPVKQYAKMAALGINDPNATHCPFSGRQLKERAFEPGEKEGALRIYPRVDATVTPERGEFVYGDPDGPDRHIAWYLHGSGLHHYANICWESRSLLYFDLASIPKDKQIKTVQFRLPSRCYTGKPEKGKPWWPPLQVYKLKDGYGNWDYDELPVWISQPPVERLLVHSGLYRWNEQSTRLWSFDLTGAVRERVAEGKTEIGLSVRAMTSAAAWPEPHGLGHCNTLYGTGCRERDLAPHLYVEFNETAR